MTVVQYPPLKFNPGKMVTSLAAAFISFLVLEKRKIYIYRFDDIPS